MTTVDNSGISMDMAKKNGKEVLLEYVREQRKPGAAPPGFVFQLSAFARAIGASRQQLRWWMKGVVKPSTEHRTQLERATNGRVAAASWS